MSRRVVLVAAAAVVAITASAGVLVLRRDGRHPPPPLDIPAAEHQARAACAAIGRFEEEVKANARGDVVLGTIEDARTAATFAADHDPRWRSLASGTDALRAAIKKNDGPAARIGIDVVRAQCQELK